ncbi:uncharacterized protein KY384_007393 [Bacidia gigantensis]|uniref:uncharacterized protein n=1 Tax=Bacidia gigantensis TaxID=2732470 RepID=UPI001D04109F|nr:uncharacterized protein KY384_007393 [Bacidia gigantensis]KAG8528475.1 hypothetical protein KY384_007393 [Bacidia gigantensis]
MAEDFAELIMTGVPAITENYEKVYDPVKDKARAGFHKVRKMRNNGRGGYEEYSTEEEDYYERPRRSQTDGYRNRRSDRDRGEVVESRRVIRGSDGRTRSVGRDGRDYRSRGSRRDYSDSEASLSPPRRSKSKRRQSLGDRALAALGLGAGAGAVAEGRRRRSRSSSSSRSRDRERRRNADRPRSSRSTAAPSSRGYDRGYDDDRTPARYKPAGYISNGRSESLHGGSGNQVARRDGNSTVAGRSKRSSSQSSSSSSDVCSSSEDERRARKMRGKEWLTAGLAAVATIHAAHGVYSSMEARDKRAMEVMKGEMSPEDARKKKNKARVQDAAAIGIAALGIKGAYSEWQEVQESRKEMGELEKEKEERHQKRLKKAEKYGHYKGQRESKVK